MSTATLPILELRGVTVRFGAVAALSRVNAVLPAGEVTCVLGENGSGKSTLVALLSGLIRHTEGRLLVSGEPMRFRSPRQARAAGIATVWQDLAVARHGIVMAGWDPLWFEALLGVLLLTALLTNGVVRRRLKAAPRS